MGWWWCPLSPATSGRHNFHTGTPIDVSFAATRSSFRPLRFYTKNDVWVINCDEFGCLDAQWREENRNATQLQRIDSCRNRVDSLCHFKNKIWNLRATSRLSPSENRFKVDSIDGFSFQEFFQGIRVDSEGRRIDSYVTGNYESTWGLPKSILMCPEFKFNVQNAFRVDSSSSKSILMKNDLLFNELMSKKDIPPMFKSSVSCIALILVRKDNITRV
ncbi:hypothetical protein PIB30_023835 [Stylosanthes scabra]|uniref:Uncharacterized protein n=1 Tax=Stylosanthes scabra TaxID=79078 RepID=A0ABU6Q9A6_9FABA|nr:hypothetical protein [Stylosanthes scabra]